jgi:hypothetical protein
MINVTKEPRDTHKIISQKRNVWEIHGEDTRHG